MPFFLKIMAIKALVPPRQVPTHLIGPFEVQLIFYLLQYLINWLFEQRINYLSPQRWRLVREVFTGTIFLISTSPRIPFLWKDLSLALPLGLIFLYPLILTNTIHKLAHTKGRLYYQWLLQLMVLWEPHFKCSNCYILKISIYFIVCFPVSIWVDPKSLILPHGHE